ncbi:ATP-binding domain-containing protein [Streptomyces durbertensis]|uniref:ATP-binding domain-containing protein n=1 Tax=Streptomyces durbertensis TaxID=2448886 RepID=A0ABR6EB27_9ACTN|nr:ATP-binding domain-containing protein [Streptomyces durbertensis]MBB1242453.1 ATP-binding domain-containing protein [Streptomyces durbertensis]
MPPRSPATPEDPLSRERTYHERCRAAVVSMIRTAEQQVRLGADTAASGADAEVLGYRLRSHAKELSELPDGPLFFGALTFAADDPAAGEHSGQHYHLGRMRITPGPAEQPLVVDWRAPVARAFYQAGADDPQGVTVRRRFGWAPGSRGEAADLTGLEDEHLGRGGQLGQVRQARRPNGGLLAAEIERPRAGPMRDIVATIQPEQDVLVRAELSESLCVQGAPGTGKTAVGLHRAAYLLYSEPRRVQRGGMLILGPNRGFLRYISQVLPALGETGVRQSTLDDEISRHQVSREDAVGTAVLKHDIRMAGVLRRALYSRVRPDRARDLVLPDGATRRRLPAEDVERVVREVRAEEVTYGVGRQRVRERLVRAVQREAERRGGPRSGAWLQRVSRARPVAAVLNAVWPVASPEEVLCELLTSADLLAAAAGDALLADEQRALLRPDGSRGRRPGDWSSADLVLLDELEGLINRPAGYGHIVIDEAQDLSPMQCRAIARRSTTGSLTVLGDLAQATVPWAASDWGRLLAHLGKPDATYSPLSEGFRVPGAVAEVANRLLVGLDVDLPPIRSLRSDGEMSVHPVADLTAAAVATAHTALGHAGSVGVITADHQADLIRRALGRAGLRPGSPETPEARLTVVPASKSKGLEYDTVVLVEPAALVRAEPRGLNLLYVAVTRAVSRLHVLHSEALPAAFLGVHGDSAGAS